MDFAEEVPNFLDGEFQNEHDDDASESCNDSDSDTGDENDDNDEDEETYIRFVRSVFCDDLSGCSNTEDEDDEEDYEPDQKDGDEIDDDSDEDDRDLIRIQNRELRELVDGCWQTIVGEAPPVQPVSIKSETEGPEIYDIGSPQRIRTNQNVFVHASPPNAGSSSSRHEDHITSHDNLIGDICDDVDDEIDLPELSPTASPMKGYLSQINGTKLMPIPSGVSTGPNAISSMVSKLLLDNDTTEVCVEGLPVTAIRNIVARQMSMATQLLTQILLQADQDSDCFTKGYTSLMELSNLREAALKKASLVQMNFRNATVIRNHSLDLQNQKKALSFIVGSDRSDRSDVNDEGDSDSDSEPEEEEDCDSMHPPLGSRPSLPIPAAQRARLASVPLEEPVIESSDTVARRLTRSAMPQGAAVHTMFNMPILGKVSTLFDMVDLSRRKIKAQLSQHHHLVMRSSSSIGEKDLKADSKARLLEAISVQVHFIMPRLNMRTWRCLVPTPHYPLPAPLVRSLDPSTLMGRCLFTPTEDDLLLRGIMITGDSDWEKIRAGYMPSKVAQTLQFRYTQMTSLTASMEDNNYKRYQKLEADYRNRDTKWSPEEELELLRAFQVFGNRWPLVRIFYFPHRKLSQLKLKWASLQKTWQRTFQGGQARSGAGNKKELTDTMRTFLEEISPLVIVPIPPPLVAAGAKTSVSPTSLGGPITTASTTQHAANSSSVSKDKSATSRTATRNLLGAASNAGVGQGAIATPLPSITSINVPPMTQGMPSAGISLQSPFPSAAPPPVSSVSQMPSTKQAAPTHQIPPVAPMQGMQAMQTAQGMQGVPAGMYPFMAAPFMMQGWMPPTGGKMPTTQAEFLAYQQQMQMQQYYQHQQYQLLLMQHQQMMSQHLQSNNNNNNNNNSIAGSAVPVNSINQQQAQQQITSKEHLPVPTSTHFNQSINLPNHAQNINPNLPAPATVVPSRPTTASEAPAHTTASAFSLDGPLLLRATEPAKRVRRIKPDLVTADPELRSPNASRTDANRQSGAAEGGSASLSSVSADQHSHSLFLHDQDSNMFSLLCPPNGDSVPFVDNLSIPYLSSDKSSSREPIASAASAVAREPGTEAPTLKGILSKPKKKTIKPTLISAVAATAGVAANTAFDAVRLPITQYTQPLSSTNTTVSTTSQVSHRAPMPASALYSDALEEEEGRSLLGLEGLSCLNWPDHQDSSSSSVEDSRLSMSASVMADISLLDASKFSFSNFAPPRFDDSRAEGNRASKSGSKKEKNGLKSGSKSGPKSANSHSKHVSTTSSKSVSSSASAGSSSSKNKSKVPTVVATPTKALRSVGSPILTRSQLASPMGDNSLFHFDETSNMSLLGDLFGDGDLHAPQGGFSNFSQLLNASRPPLHSALNSPQGVRRPPMTSGDQHNKKRSHSAAEKTGQSSARPFQNISSRSNTHSNTDRNGIANAITSSHYLNHNSSSAIGPSPKKQKKSVGLFAEVMAKARR